MPRILRLPCLFLVVCLVGPLADIQPVRASTPVTLEVYDEHGRRLSYQEVLAVTTAQGKGWRNDVTYRISDGTIVAKPALTSVGEEPSFAGGGGVGLSLAWPTAHTGYSTLFLDNGGQGFGSGGTVNLTYRAALDYRAKLDDALAARPEYTPGAEFTTLDDRATSLISQAEGSSDPSVRGALGQRALDALAQAFEVLLREDGRLRERAHPGWWGATIDQTTRSHSVVGSLADLVDHRRGAAYARVVFDPGWTPAHYDAIVRESRKEGITVVGQILDSSGMRKLSMAAWRHRVRTFVNHFPGISAWEIGNEVNGEWLGPNVSEKVTYAARYVHRRDPGDTTVLTFYWEMGTAGTSGASLFQWISDHVSPRLASAVDVVALSTWIGDAPLGISMEEVFQRIAALFPSQRIAMGELGYWSPGTTKAWWWRSTRNPTTTVRTALARQMYLASRAFAGSVGGVFWWYYVQEMSRRTPPWHAVHRVYRSTR